MSELEIRHAQIRAVDTNAREVTGLAVPWDTDVTIGGSYTERIARGAVQDSDGALLYWQHAEPIGKITSARDTDAGWEITARISETPRGEEAYTLLRDGVIDKFSIGFDPVEHHTDEAGVVVRTKIRVRETSLVSFPAYEDAKVAQVRQAATANQKEPHMSETTTDADLSEIRSAIEDLERTVALAATATPSERVDQFRSFGHYVQAVASGDDAAARAYAGAVSGDAILKDAWIGNLVKIMGEKQIVTNAFTKGTLPAQGLAVEYAVLKSDSTQVGVQAAEGDDLLFGKVAIEPDTAPVKTLGGWSSLSRQAIERSNVGILDTTFTALAVKYAKAVETLTRTTLTTALGTADEIEGDLSTQDGILAALIDLAEHFDAADLSLNGLFVAKDVFLDLLAVPATDRVLQVSSAPTDKVGTVTVSSVSGDLAGLKVSLLPGATAGTVFGYDSSAIKTLESAGSPLRLQDENIVNLSRDFSVYGYAASFVQVPDALVKITAGA